MKVTNNIDSKIKETNVLVRLIFILITLATVLNGSYFWLSRVGLINSGDFNVLVEKNTEFKQRTMAYINQPETLTKEVEAALRQEHLLYKKQLYGHLYNHSVSSILLKSLKYVVYLVLIVSIFKSATKSDNPDKLESHIKLFAVFVFVYLVMSYANFGVAGVIAGFNSAAFLTVLLFSTNYVNHRDIQNFAFLLLITLALLLLIAPYEMLKGIQVFNTNSFLGKRMTGFMDQPSTMGIYVVCTFSTFAVLFRSQMNKAKYIVLCGCALLLVILSGSNTASLVLSIFLLVEFWRQMKASAATLQHGVLAMLALVVLILIVTEGRPIMNSFDGRLEKYRYYFSLDLTALKLLFGHGIGAGSNLLLQLQTLTPFEQLPSLPIKFSIDSTPLLLLIQTGFIGCALIYSLMIVALIKDKPRRSLYITFILCSMTINLIEVFPLNILLALLLSNSLNPAKPKKCRPA